MEPPFLSYRRMENTDLNRVERRKRGNQRMGLRDIVLSWSFQDICNENLFKDQVFEIPETFESTTEYKSTFAVPLLEEARALLHSELQDLSKSRYCAISEINVTKSYKPPNSLYYEIILEKVLNSRGEVVGKYEPERSDVFVITDVMPERIEDVMFVIHVIDI